MNISLHEAMTVLGLNQGERIKILSLSPKFENGTITYTSDCGRHLLRTTPGRFLKRNVPRLTASEVKLFAELLCKPTTVVITNDIDLFKKAYVDITSCMTQHLDLLHTYIDAGISLAISYLGDKIIGRMLVDTNSKKCNSGYGNFTYLARYLLSEGFYFTEQWLDGVAFKPISEGRYMYLPYLDTPSKLKLLGGKFVVSVDGEYVIQPKTNRVVIMKTTDELFSFCG